MACFILCFLTSLLAVSVSFDHGKLKSLEDQAEKDHEAFLGKDVSHEYDELSPSEAKAKLALLLPKLDTDSDGDIDEKELHDWIKIQIMDFVERDAQKALPHEDTNKDGIVSWEEYVTNTFGKQYLTFESMKPSDDTDDYVRYVKRDKLRFDLADQDDDDSLTFEEFQAFLHPEEFEHMAKVVVEETIDDMDENKDGKVSLKEYIGDFFDIDEENDSDNNDKEWVELEKKSFRENKDTNGDGYLDREELEAWIIPSETNYAADEAKHLIQKSDTNKDGVLSFAEIIENHEAFVGSQATDYGRILHEEL